MNPFYEVRSQTLFVGRICDVPFPLHVHKVVECVHIFSGSIRMNIGGQLLDVFPGDTVAIFPSVAHSYEFISPEAKGLCTIFLPDAIAEFADTFRVMRPVSPLLPADEHDAPLNEAIERLQVISRKENSPLITSYLHVFLAHLFTHLDLQPLEDHVDVSLTQQVLQYLSQHFLEELTLDSVARALGISRSHLSHIFSAQLRINFRRYINTLRIDHACVLLKETDMTITEICYACGYNNPRTFHRAFLEERSMQPSEYRDRNLR